MSQMIASGHVHQDAHDQVVLNGEEGYQRFGVGLPPQQIQPRQNVADGQQQEEPAQQE